MISPFTPTIIHKCLPIVFSAKIYLQKKAMNFYTKEIICHQGWGTAKNWTKFARFNLEKHKFCGFLKKAQLLCDRNWWTRRHKEKFTLFPPWQMTMTNFESFFLISPLSLQFIMNNNYDTEIWVICANCIKSHYVI